MTNPRHPYGFGELVQRLMNENVNAPVWDDFADVAQFVALGADALHTLESETARLVAAVPKEGSKLVWRHSAYMRRDRGLIFVGHSDRGGAFTFTVPPGGWVWSRRFA